MHHILKSHYMQCNEQRKGRNGPRSDESRTGCGDVDAFRQNRSQNPHCEQSAYDRHAIGVLIDIPVTQLTQ